MGLRVLLARLFVKHARVPRRMIASSAGQGNTL